MAEERTITTVFKADISNFTSSTQELNRYVSQVNSEFKNATASMGRWNDNATGLKAKLEQLNKVHEAEKLKLKDLESQYEKVVKEQGENSKAAQKLATAVNEQSAKVKECEKNIDFYSDSLKELEDAGVETKGELEELNKKLDEQKEATKELGGNIAAGAAAGIAGIGAACVGALAGLNGLVEETKELRTQMAQLETTFTQQGHSVEAAEKTYNDLFAVLGDSGKAQEAGMHLAQMAKSEEDLNALTNTLTGVYATFGDSLPVEGLAEALNHTAKLGSVQGSLADALEWSGVNVDDFNKELEKLNTEEERAALINDTLNGIYGETAQKYKEVNADVIAANKAQNEYNQAMADIGEAVQPAITSFKTSMVGVLQKVLEKFNEVDIAGIVGKIGDAITNIVDAVMPPLMTAIDWVIDNADWLLPVLGSIVGIIGGITAAVQIYTTAQTILNAVMAANPIMLIVAAIAALVAGFVLLWQNCEGFRNFWIGLWEGIKNAVSVVVDWIKAAWETVSTGLIAAWEGISALFSTVATWIYDNVIKPVADFFTGLWEGIVSAWHTVIDPWIEIVKRLAALINETVIVPIKDFFVGLWNGITEGAKAAWDKIVEVFLIVANWFNETLIQPIANFFSGMWNGLKNGAKAAWEGIKSVFTPIVEWFGNVFKKAWQKVKDVFSVGGKIFDGIKDGIVTAFKAVVNAIIGGINKVIAIPFKAINAVLEKLKGINILGVQPFGWVKTFTIPEIPKLARGGIVDKPTLAMVGEAGKEAVIPLENNTSWIDKLADKLNAKASGGNKTYNITNNFERMETSRHALHKANLELRRTVMEG